MVFPDSLPAGWALQVFCQPHVPTLEAGHVLALALVQVVLLVANATIEVFEFGLLLRASWQSFFARLISHTCFLDAD